MSNTDDIRWGQRLENFEKAYLVLEGELEKRAGGEYSLLERAGIVQLFECAYELSWKTLKDWLFVEGYDEKTPKGVIRRGFEVEILSEGDTELFLEALQSRNIMSHTYDEEKANEVVGLIEKLYVPMLGRLYRELEKRRD